MTPPKPITTFEVMRLERIEYNLRMSSATAAVLPWAGYGASQFAPGSSPAPWLVLACLLLLSSVGGGAWVAARVRYVRARRRLRAALTAAG